MKISKKCEWEKKEKSKKSFFDLSTFGFIVQHILTVKTKGLWEFPSSSSTSCLRGKFYIFLVELSCVGNCD
jgi:hypothetical protein